VCSGDRCLIVTVVNICNQHNSKREVVPEISEHKAHINLAATSMHVDKPMPCNAHRNHLSNKNIFSLFIKPPKELSFHF
jgi:hypothetical protein